MKQRFFQGLLVLIGVGLLVFALSKDPKRPGLPKWQMQEKMLSDAEGQAKAQAKKSADVAWIKLLLKENSAARSFDFPVVAEAVSGKKVIPWKSMDREAKIRVGAAIDQAMIELLTEMNHAESPVKGLRRINEGSRYFEEGLQRLLDAMTGIRCEFPKTREGARQRSGYPDLVMTDELTGQVFYLDPKLFEESSMSSSLRTFYFEPKNETLKITHDAVHLLIGVGHDGKDGDWRFTGYRLVDLSGLKVRLKTEFQASNKDLYLNGSVLETVPDAGKDGSR